MGSNKLIAAAFANLALLASVNAGPCKPQSIMTSATGSTTVVSDTTPALSTTIEISTTISEAETTTETETTTTLTDEGTTTGAPVSETSTTIAISESTTVAGSSDTTMVTSSDATTAPTTTEGTTTVAGSATTTTTEAEPTELLINGNFDLGTVNPWLSDNGPIQLGPASEGPYQGPAYASLQFGESDDNESVNNRVYQKIDKSLLKAGSYKLSAWLRVDQATVSQLDDGCNAMAVGCYYGDPSNIVPVQGGSNTVSADDAVNQWASLDVICSLSQEKLDQYGYLSVSVGFSCKNAEGDVDAVTLEEVGI